MDFPTYIQSKKLEVHTLFLTLNTLKVATIYLLNGTLGRKLRHLQPTPSQYFKPCGNFKARIVVDEHLNKETTKKCLLRSCFIEELQICFTAEPNNFQLWGADDENAYLQALTKEKLNWPRSSRYTRTCSCYIQGTQLYKTCRSMLV